MRRPAPVRELATNVQPSLRVDGTKVWSRIQLERQLRPNAFAEPLGGHPAIERGISGMHPQQYRRRTRYRPPAGWYRRINRSLVESGPDCHTARCPRSLLPANALAWLASRLARLAHPTRPGWAAPRHSP